MCSYGYDPISRILLFPLVATDLSSRRHLRRSEIGSTLRADEPVEVSSCPDFVVRTNRLLGATSDARDRTADLVV